MNEIRFLNESPSDGIIRMGKIYQDTDGALYLLAGLGGEAVLVSLNDGNRYSEPTKVNNLFDISSNEWSKLQGRYGKFREVKSPLYVTPRW